MRGLAAGAALFALSQLASPAPAAGGPREPRFPQPQFSSGYAPPVQAHPMPRPGWRDLLDAGVLAGALGLAAHLSLSRRNRREIALLGTFSLLYFGFLRAGCACPIGSVQNVAGALADPSSPLPLVVLAFFLLPLFAALLWGRAFCAGACPQGALQDLLVVHPLRVPPGLDSALGVLPSLHLGTAVLFAALGAGSVVCRYDPFVPLFRQDGGTGILLAGAGVLLLGLVVARPYCRYLCPYGVLLRWASRLSLRRATITPSQCVDCRLCEDSCPFGAIQVPPRGETPPERARRRRTLGALWAALPLLALGGGWLGHALASPLSLAHPAVALADRMAREEAGTAAAGVSPEADAFRRGDRPLSSLLDEAGAIRGRFADGGLLLGGFFGLVLGARLIGTARRRTAKGYLPDRGSCLSCGRCFDSCPVELLHRGGTPQDLARLAALAAREGDLRPLRGEMKAGRLRLALGRQGEDEA